jgi:DNA helicase-2/ATP-dependent DNA helicase PcrA
MSGPDRQGSPRAAIGARGIAELIGGRTPTDEQVAVIEAPAEPLLVVAGAGSGKTETMSMRVLWLVADQGIAPESILGLTFTRKAAAELGARLRDRLGRLAAAVPGLEEAGDPVSLTYNSFAERLVAEHGLRIGIDPDVRLLGQAGAVQMMGDIVAQWHDDLDAFAGKSPATVVTRALAMAGHLAEHDLALEEARRELGRFEEELLSYADAKKGPGGTLRAMVAANRERSALLDLVAAFDARKREAGMMDFGDQLMLATRIVREAPDVVDQIRADHAAVLLDEFQDTSVIQMELLSRLFRDHPVTAVGDPNQAIYGWRGASAASLEGFLGRFQSTPAREDQTLTLSTSWRNDIRVLEVSNRVAAPLREHARNAASPVLAPRAGAGAGRVDVAYTSDRDAQAQKAADFIQEVRTPRGSRMPTAAVLCRRRADFQIVDEALRARDIPTQVIGLGGLLDQPAVADARAALEIAVDVTNSPWLVRLLANLDLGAADLRLMGRWARHLARRTSGAEHPETLLLDAVDAPPEAGWRPSPQGPAFTEAAAARVRVLGQRLRAVRRGSGRGVVEQVERAISILGLAEDATADPLHNTGREALDGFIDVAADFEAQVPGATMRGFLTWLAVAEDEENGLAGPAAQPDPAAVQILTVHGAKGLEWDAVAVFNLSDGIFPSHRSTPESWTEDPVASSAWLTAGDQLPYPLRGDADSLPSFVPELGDARTVQAAFNKWVDGAHKADLGRHMEREERRLAYVALTRARESLLMIGCWKDTSATPRPPSRYLMEPLTAGLTDADPSTAVPPCPDKEALAALGAAGPAQAFPRRPGRSRELATDAARRVLARASSLDRARASTQQILSALEGHPAARDVRALLDERRLREERRSTVVVPARLPATSVSGIVEDRAAFARDLRRPVPAEPSESSALGTLFHAWAERQLRLTSGELWDEPLAGEEALSARDRDRLDAMRANFWSLPLLEQQPVAVEEPFSVEIAGMSVQGRIDAVFRDRDGTDTVVDWKSGRVPSELTTPRELRYFLTQLQLYRTAWARRMGVGEDRVRARVAFLAGPRILDLGDVAGMLREALARESRSGASQAGTAGSGSARSASVPPAAPGAEPAPIEEQVAWALRGR